ncbi:sensor histidine kinase [Paenibacillus cymbidii]|uniref:sensor histidine kinase n=1 Tax=Paenibacillus cymbidii TaxID=1639034 RepID=UPI00107FFAA8|nr:sensor histidine kinase [Paenibacillus cymbidii]
MKVLDRLHSIQYKLTITFLLILTPLVCVSIFASGYSQSIVSGQVSDRTQGALLTTLEYVNQLTQSMDQQTLLIGSNPNIVDVWNTVDNPLSPDHLYELHTVQQQLSALTNVNGAIKEAFILHGDSENGVSTLVGGIRWPGVKQELWFKRVVDARGGLVVHVPSAGKADQSAYLNKDMIYYARLLDVLSNNKEPNVLVLAVDKTSFRKIIQHLQTSKDTNIALYYNNDFVLETNQAAALPEQAGDSPKLFSSKADNGFWSIQLKQPKQELFKASHKLQLLTYLIVLISVVLAVWIAWLVYAAIAKPLQQLSAAFKQFAAGNLTARVVHRRRDEFGYVMNGFNRMAEAQRLLIEDDYEKELRLAKSEFSLLQSQINPHFLYNTLDSIYSVALKNNIREISEMVLNLARFFRVSLGKGRETFTLEETLQHLMYYIRVQQFRSDRFAVDMDIAEETKRIPVLKLILQPIVENAIVHGLESTMQEGTLHIRSRLENGCLRLEIEDTGTGIPPDKLAHMREELEAITSRSYRSRQGSAAAVYYGLKNVKSRIKMYYGEQAELQIESEAGTGTKVSLLIPLQKEEPS